MSSAMSPTTGINEQNFTQSGALILSFNATTSSNCITSSVNIVT